MSPPEDALAPLLTDPARTVVALDFDGTLAPIVADPERAVAHPEAAGVLARLAERIGAVVIITGRPAAVAVRLGGLQDVPRLVVHGHYGLERWHDGVLESPDSADGVDRAREQIADLVAAAPAGTWLEDKGHSVAVHTRNAAEPQATLDAVRAQVDQIATEAGLEVVPGRFVLELRPPGIDKGAALRSVVTELGATAVLFGGDDLGDLPALDALDALRSEGLSTVVLCSDSEETPAALRDRADLRVPGPAGIVATLQALADRLAV